MATLDLGKIKQVWRGTYNNSTAYVVDDLVAYTDSNITSTYICVANSTGNAPSSSGTAHASWNYVAKGVVDPVPSQSGNSGKFLTTNGSAASWGNAGITEADQWYVNAHFFDGMTPIASNLVRDTTANRGNQIGTGMSQSSGIFTFPSTGFWFIQFQAQCSRVDAGAQSRYNQIIIKSTNDNFSSSEVLAFGEAGFFDNYNASYRYHGAYCSAVFDCTNTSTHKVRFDTDCEDTSGSGIRWSTPYTKMSFIKLADT